MNAGSSARPALDDPNCSGGSVHFDKVAGFQGRGDARQPDQRDLTRLAPGHRADGNEQVRRIIAHGGAFEFELLQAAIMRWTRTVGAEGAGRPLSRQYVRIASLRAEALTSAIFPATMAGETSGWLSNCPAKECPAPSSIVPDERTANHAGISKPISPKRAKAAPFPPRRAGSGVSGWRKGIGSHRIVLRF